MTCEEPRRSKVDGVVATLRHEILRLDLVPGTVISRPALQQRFGLSSTPIRDALIRLEREDLVVIQPQSRTVVTRIDVSHVQRAHVLRLAIDLEVSRMLLVQDDARTRARLATICDTAEERLASGDREAFDRADTEFHLLQYQAVGMEDLWWMIQRRSGHMNRVRRLNLASRGNPERIIADHRAIIAAMEAGDVSALATAVRHHLTRSSGTVARLREAHPDFFTSGIMAVAPADHAGMPSGPVNAGAVS